MTARVGVTELRKNLSVYLHRVKDGETLEITERGRPVARLTPVPARQRLLDRWIAEGKARPATMRIEDLPPPIKLLPGAEPISETLRRMREEERY